MSETVNLLAGEYKFDLPNCYCDFTAVEVFVIRHGDALGVGDRLRILQSVRTRDSVLQACLLLEIAL
jgi:hypothetical protein